MTSTIITQTNVPVGTLVTVFDEYPGVVIKGHSAPNMVLVLYQMPGNVKVRGSVAFEDVKERKK